jgi:hypothetical protein
LTAVCGVFLGSVGASEASVYAGETAQHDPIAITVSKDGKRVQKIAVDWEARCQSGADYPFGGVLTARPKPPDVFRPGDNPLLGSTVRQGKLRAFGMGAVVFDNDQSGFIRETINGRFKKSSASGTWRARMNVQDAAGTTKDTCDSGTFRWSAIRGPTSYGGSTTQGEPVVVLTTKDRSKVDYFGVGWGASCSDGGFFHIGDELGNFPLTSGGLFGDNWSSEFPFQDGSGKASFTYTVKGALKKGRGGGTFSVHRAESDTSGATTSTCDTQSVHWSVTQ